MGEKKRSCKRFGKAMVVLIRNTTWRCGKIERLIVKHLHNESLCLGKPGTPVKDILENFGFDERRKNDFLDAIRRLERRNIVRILKL